MPAIGFQIGPDLAMHTCALYDLADALSKRREALRSARFGQSVVESRIERTIIAQSPLRPWYQPQRDNLVRLDEQGDLVALRRQLGLVFLE